ncbi:lactadherin-like [Asterias amurensis]|uniref:lactadherin-like n=1 Tax=Asterias amurensis TaxID=7602 RepID=UPI003AB35B39
MGGVKSFSVLLAYLGAYLGIVASRHVCFIGTVYSKDVESLRWVLPYDDPCLCSVIRPGGHLPYKPKNCHYLEGLFLTEDSQEIHKFFNCQAICDEPGYLGVGIWDSQSGVTPLLEIQNDQFNSSSNDNDGSFHCTAASARLNFAGGSPLAACWKPAGDSPGDDEWVSVRLARNVLVSGITTQGRGNDGSGRAQWVTEYKVEYSTSENIDHYVELKSIGGLSKFIGNIDTNSYVINVFQHQVIASSIRILPTTWQDKIALRFELHGCLLE